MPQVRRRRPQSCCTRQGHLARQGGVAPSRVVGGLELGQFMLQIWPIPEQDLVEKLATNRPNQSLDEWVGPREMWHRFDLVDLEDPEIRRPAVCPKDWIMIGADSLRGAAVPVYHGIEPPAHVGARDSPSLHTEADQPAGVLVRGRQQPVAAKHDRFAAKEVDAPETVGRVAEDANHEGPPPRGVGRSCLASTRCTMFLSTSTPNVCERMRAMRGQPHRGLRSFSWTIRPDLSVQGVLDVLLTKRAGGICDAPKPDDRPEVSKDEAPQRPSGSGSQAGRAPRIRRTAGRDQSGWALAGGPDEAPSVGA